MENCIELSSNPYQYFQHYHFIENSFNEISMKCFMKSWWKFNIWNDALFLRNALHLILFKNLKVLNFWRWAKSTKVWSSLHFHQKSSARVLPYFKSTPITEHQCQNIAGSPIRIRKYLRALIIERWNLFYYTLSRNECVKFLPYILSRFSQSQWFILDDFILYHVLLHFYSGKNFWMLARCILHSYSSIRPIK